MNLLRKKYILATITVILILLIDQIVKISVKTSLFSGQEIEVIKNFFYIHFTENPGMAFGMVFGGDSGKLFLSIFRLVAIGGITYFLIRSIKRDMHTGFIFSVALILAGAAGNMIDCAFYGLIFDDSTNRLAALFPAHGGYGTFLKGNVVDMFYFPMIHGHFPAWVPKFGGDEFTFFNAIFNVADSSISVGVAIIFIFQGKFFPTDEVLTENVDATTISSGTPEEEMNDHAN